MRFITPDSIDYLDSSSIIGLNLYAYCGNNPINMIDEEGNSGILAFALIVVGLCIFISTIYTVEYHTNKNYYENGDEVFGK